MKEYICVDDTYKSLDKDERKTFLKLISKSMHYTKSDICKDMVSKEVVEQIMWERDLAIKQLNDLGIGLGEKKSKADICRAFAEKIKDRLYYCDDLSKEYGITIESGFKILGLIDDVLAEMGSTK